MCSSGDIWSFIGAPRLYPHLDCHDRSKVILLDHYTQTILKGEKHAICGSRG
jgi:hypothetical protein